MEDVKKRAFEMEMNSHGCSQVVVQTFLDVFEQEDRALFMAASPFAAGMSLTGNNCGGLIGGLMILGTVFGRKSVKEGMPGILEGIRPMRKLVKYFNGLYPSIDCRDITGTDLADPEKSEA
ncbi:MAG TPA: C-GCAxxG-C-C family protein, partial [Deltaproteobacteria bacterium]|nr:C-GCAxxG-C-C family protein [Deltaproteobacteria bacterium]